MEFATYADFRTSFRFALDAGVEGLPPKRPTEFLDMAIALGESRVHHKLRASTMDTSATLAVTSNAATLPSDLLALKEVRFSGEPPLDVIGLDRLRAMEAGDDATGAQARYCAQDGDTLRFWPVASGDALVRYYARPAALRSVVWASATTFARYPEVYLYAALTEAAPLIGRDPVVWEAKYQQFLGDAMHDERVRVYSGGPLKVRSR